MHIDETEKQTLESELNYSLATRNQGMLSLIMGALRGGLRSWVLAINAAIIIVSLCMLWAGVEFSLADDIDARVFWGVWFLALIGVQIAMKQWFWMEINRNSLLREIQRMEAELHKLKAKL